MKDYAKNLLINDSMDEYWIFIYECLDLKDLQILKKNNQIKYIDEWIRYKKNNITFLQDNYKIK